MAAETAFISEARRDTEYMVGICHFCSICPSSDPTLPLAPWSSFGASPLGSPQVRESFLPVSSDLCMLPQGVWPLREWPRKAETIYRSWRQRSTKQEPPWFWPIFQIDSPAFSVTPCTTLLTNPFLFKLDRSGFCRLSPRIPTYKEHTEARRHLTKTCLRKITNTTVIKSVVYTKPRHSSTSTGQALQNGCSLSLEHSCSLLPPL